MGRYSENRRRYLILPGRGVSGTAMQASVFKPEVKATAGLALAEALESGLADQTPNKRSMRAMGNTVAASADLIGTIGNEDFEIVSQRFDDGPALVKMTHAARLALEATNPDIRVFPITRYYLPGHNPRRGASAAAAAPSAQTAVRTDGTVFGGDAKQHFLAGDGGNGGKGVIVGVLDTGIDNTHPALKASVAALRCYVPGVAATAGGPVDWGPANRTMAAHGTHVAGIIAAAAGFGGPPGVAPKASLISYRIFPDDRSRMKGAENPVIIDSIRAAIEDGCHIVNLSIEGPTLKEDGVRSAIADAWDNGVLCVSVAGNGFGNPVSYPGALPHCIAVTAVGRDDCFPAEPEFQAYVTDQRATSDPAVFLASFSNYGRQVQFTAPGHAIVSTFPNNEWWFDSGTSMAAPFVAGLAARALSGQPDILGMTGNAARSAAMLQMLIGRARTLGLPQGWQEGYGLPV